MLESSPGFDQQVFNPSVNRLSSIGESERRVCLFFFCWDEAGHSSLCCTVRGRP